jgi:hypothetical protein
LFICERANLIVYTVKVGIIGQSAIDAAVMCVLILEVIIDADRIDIVA